MNKLMTAAAAVFEAYPEAEAVFVCEDGNVFLEERKNLAENHCRTERLPAPKLVKRTEVGGTLKDAVISALSGAVANASLDLGEGGASTELVDQRTELERRADEEAEAGRERAAAEAEAKAKAEAGQAAAEAKAKKEAAAKDKGGKKNGK